MTTKNSAGNAADSENVTTDELQDPMSGYTSADALPPNDAPKHEIHGAERLRDPMSGYAGADAMRSDAKTDEADVDRVHAEEAKDSMSGYASADSLDSDEK